MLHSVLYSWYQSLHLIFQELIVHKAKPAKKKKEDVAAYCLKLPGSYMNLSVLLAKSKFRVYDNKAGALLGFETLQKDQLGDLEQCSGH